MTMYNKLYTKILDSSIWLEPNPTRIVWITFLAAMDEDGFAQFSSVRNLANRAMVTPEDAEKAVATLESPDSESASKDHDGRRIERVDGGWMILNAGLYRDIVTRTEKLRLNRERVARHRAKKARNAAGNAPVMQSYAGSEALSESKTLRSPSSDPLSTVLSDRANGSDVLTKREIKRRSVRDLAAAATKGMPQ